MTAAARSLAARAPRHLAPGPVHPIRRAIGAQGWTCDRITAGMHGAGYLARALAARFGRDFVLFGDPSAAGDGHWQAALPRAKPVLEEMGRVVRAELAEPVTPLLVLNKCGTSLATLPAVFEAWPDAMLLWVDAHGDYHTPDSTVTGYLGGMVISALANKWQSGYGTGLTPDRVVLAGQRDLDGDEAALIARDGIPIVTGQGDVLDVERIVTLLGGRPSVLHIDLDVLDPAVVQAEYVVPGGLSAAALARLVRRVVETTPLVAIEVTEFSLPEDPALAERTAVIVADILAPLFD